MSCVILQRRKLRRSGCELGRETGLELLGVLLITSCIAMKSSPEKFTAFLEESVRVAGDKTYRGLVPEGIGTGAGKISTEVLEISKWSDLDRDTKLVLIWEGSS